MIMTNTPRLLRIVRHGYSCLHRRPGAHQQRQTAARQKTRPADHCDFFTVLAIGLLFTANSLMHGHDGTSGVDWAQATKIGYALLLSPLVGFGFAALLLLPCGFSSRIARCTRPRWATLRHRHPNYLTTT
jgi:hypothetical protein